MTTSLRPMTEAEFESFRQTLIREYAADNVRAGYWTEEESLERAAKDTANLLPQGVNTENHYLYILEDNSASVGVIWMRVQEKQNEKTGFIFEVRIDDEQRGRGYGKKIMLLLEEKAREMGVSKIGLHVFGFNEIAKKLYLSLGYEISSLNMQKKI